MAFGVSFEMSSWWRDITLREYLRDAIVYLALCIWRVIVVQFPLILVLIGKTY
jgi:hypothetical protein